MTINTATNGLDSELMHNYSRYETINRRVCNSRILYSVHPRLLKTPLQAVKPIKRRRMGQHFKGFRPAISQYRFLQGIYRTERSFVINTCGCKKWARPDLNWSYVHPKHEGYQATPRARVIRGNLFLFKCVCIKSLSGHDAQTGFLIVLS